MTRDEALELAVHIYGASACCERCQSVRYFDDYKSACPGGAETDAAFGHYPPPESRQIARRRGRLMNCSYRLTLCIMPDENPRLTPLAYRTPTMPGPARPPAWPTLVAYVLLALPLVYTLVAEHADPAPPDTAAMLYVTIGIAVGAGLFIVRRSPRNVIGWIGLVGWGGLSLAAIVRALIA